MLIVSLLHLKFPNPKIAVMQNGVAKEIPLLRRDTCTMSSPPYYHLFSDLCWEKATVAYTKPQQREKEESERLRVDREIRSSLLILDLKDGKL